MDDEIDDAREWLEMRRTRHDDKKNIADQALEWRNRLCECKKGDSPGECVQDLRAHGVKSRKDAERLKNKDGSWIVQKPLPESTTLYDEMNELSSRTRSSPNQASEEHVTPPRRNHPWLLLSFAILVALLGMYTKWPKQQRQRPPCAARVAGRIEEALEAMQTSSRSLHLAIGEASKATSAISKMRTFFEELTHDWSDENNPDTPLNRAVSLRLQGSDPAKVLSLMETVLNEAFPPDCHCRSRHLLSIDLSDTSAASQSPVETVDFFLSESKRENQDEISLVILRGCHSRNANQKAMSLKNHLYLGMITSAKGSAASPLFDKVPSRGVGFIFLGGDLPGDRCHATPTVEHDSSSGWDDNVLGRIVHRAKVCPSIV